MKIYDCTMFFDEKMMYEVRLNILDQFVDKFVVVESLYTHKGNKKKQNFNIEDYKKFKDKIIYILINEEPKDLYDLNPNLPDVVGKKRMNSLKRIELQYNSLSKGIVEADPDDLIILSDCDEIPNLENIKLNKIRNEILLFKQKAFYYKFNLLHENIDWFGSKACKKKKLISFDWLRYIKNKKYPFWRLDAYFSKNKYINLKIEESGGWHFTNIKTNEEIFYKLTNYGEHNEFDLSGLTKEKIQELINNHQLYFDHTLDKTKDNKYSGTAKLKKIKNDYLPKYVTDNHEKYKSWFA